MAGKNTPADVTETAAVASPLLDVGEAVLYLRTNRTSLLGWVRAGELPHVRLGDRRVLFRVADLDAFVDSRVRHGR